MNEMRGMNLEIEPERNDCGKCQYFDKSAYPKNPRFGKCLYPVPKLPVWLKGSSTNNVADYYVDCATFKEAVAIASGS